VVDENTNAYDERIQINMSLDILAFFAHPDDETMLCGGTLALLAQAGARVHILIATRGEGGEMGEPALCTREQLGQVREDELRCAAQALGAHSLGLLNYCDPVVGPEDSLFAFTDNMEQLAQEVTDAVIQYHASAVITHGMNGEYGHPAHVLSHQAVRTAVENLGENRIGNHRIGDHRLLLYTVQGMFAEHPYPRLANQDTPAHLVIDVSPFLPHKTQAAFCHRTQNALFVRHRSEEAGRLLSVREVVMNVESLHRVLPPVGENGALHDALSDLLWASGLARQPGKT
jgi:LmbE family N-acetylglucosaminyl deacetylase